jgi:hypothetical protein
MTRVVASSPGGPDKSGNYRVVREAEASYQYTPVIARHVSAEAIWVVLGFVPTHEIATLRQVGARNDAGKASRFTRLKPRTTFANPKS